MARDRLSSILLWAASLTAACGGAPQPVDASKGGAGSALPRRADVPDDCMPQPGKPPPKPLVREYTGVAAGARCQREVYTIMGGLTHFLGVKCAYCHEEPDYPKMTHNKHVANWMARDLIPALKRKTGAEVWCNDCHVVEGKGTAKILRNPRDERWALEWMTTHLGDTFDARDGKPLFCKSCHGGNIGTPEFRRKIILSKLRLSKGGDAPPEPEPDAGVSPMAPSESATADAGTDAAE